ncbi:PhoP regulatory network YrbL family protein [Methylobacillus caricis]|uniref:PhoP regulatory network YrbL family protein n=1 Tax=Methylobacillus caricis TaxID=1971611 RepID=UPI001CFF970D|nr:PhoP regulatory network YrbL family protein [Methylobacillus caricis]MCB5186887.1 PhoP regulatory network YrbL family protein [Methylobacillus caricis]
MKLVPRWKIRNSQLLIREDFEQMLKNAKVLEQDGRGIKVLQLESGNIFKIFRLRHTISLAQIYSYARHFCRNADRLQALNIPTVEVVQLFHFEESTDTAVLYRPLPGRTLRQLGLSGLLDESLMREFGKFVARLHEHGIYFRSLHFGNVVLTPEGKLGLIDIADLKVRSLSLTAWHRARNFRHLQRVPADWATLSLASRQAFADSYFSYAKLSVKTKALLLPKLKFLSS